MAYRDDSRGYRNTSLALGSFVLMFVLMIFVRPVIDDWLNRAALTTETGAKTSLTSDPLIGPMMVTIRDRFPEDFTRIITNVNAEVGAIGEVGVGAGLVRDIDAIVVRDQHWMKRAPGTALAAVRDSELAVLLRLQRTNPTICADFGETGTTKQRLSPETGGLMLTLREKILLAIAAGRDTPVAERRPTPAAIAAAQARLRETLSTAVQSSQARELLTGERTPERALPMHRCELQVALRYALTSVGAETADLLMTAP